MIYTCFYIEQQRGNILWNCSMFSEIGNPVARIVTGQLIVALC
jgi:hypothetical protein